MITGNEPAGICTTERGYVGQYTGLTIREHFAAMAMQGMCGAWLSDNVTGGNEQAVAEQSVKFADALIDELNKTQP